MPGVLFVELSIHRFSGLFARSAFEMTADDADWAVLLDRLYVAMRLVSVEPDARPRRLR